MRPGRAPSIGSVVSRYRVAVRRVHERDTQSIQRAKTLRTTNQTLAGRSASLRMYQGNQADP